MEANTDPNPEKLREMAVLLADLSQDHQGYCHSERLHALMYWADSAAQAETGTSISGATYRNHTYGPWPIEWAEPELALTKEGAIAMKHDQQPTKVDGYVRALREARTEVFTLHELYTIRRIAGKYEFHTTQEVGELARKEPAYLNAGIFADAPLSVPDKMPIPQLIGRGVRLSAPRPTTEETADELIGELTG